MDNAKKFFKEFDSIEEGLEKLYDSVLMVKDDSVRSQILIQMLQLQATITVNGRNNNGKN